MYSNATTSLANHAVNAVVCLMQIMNFRSLNTPTFDMKY